MSAQGSSHSVWTYADELLHPRGKGGKFAHKPGGGKADVKLRGGVVMSGVQFDDKGNGHAYLGSGLHTHFHPNGTSTTHTHKQSELGLAPPEKGDYHHWHSEGSGSQARADAVIKPAADAPDPTEPPHNFEPGLYSAGTGEATMEVFPDGSALVTPTVGGPFTISAADVDDLHHDKWIPKPTSLGEALAGFHGAASAPAKPINPNGFAATHDDLTTDTAIGLVAAGDIWIKDGSQAYLITSVEVDPPHGGVLKGMPIRDNGEVSYSDEQTLASYDQADEDDFLLATIPLSSPDYPLDPQILEDAGVSAAGGTSGLTDAHHGPPEAPKRGSYTNDKGAWLKVYEDGSATVYDKNGDAQDAWTAETTAAIFAANHTWKFNQDATTAGILDTPAPVEPSALAGHYAGVPDLQEGFTVHADGSATWDDGTVMLPNYVSTAHETALAHHVAFTPAAEPDSPPRVEGVYVTSLGSHLLLFTDGSSLIKHPDGSSQQLSKDMTLNEVLGGSWIQASSAQATKIKKEYYGVKEPADPHVGTGLADDAPAGIYGKPGIAGKIVKYDDGWALLKPNGAVGPKKPLSSLGPEGPGASGQWKYEKPLPAPSDEELVSTSLYNGPDLPDAPAPVAGAYVSPPIPPAWGSDVYKHPAGGTIYVHPDGSLEAWDKHGKKKTTSASALKLAEGHGQWTWTDSSQWEQPHPDWKGTPAPTLASPSAPSPAPGSQWISPKGDKILEVTPAGNGEVTEFHGVEPEHTYMVSADYVNSNLNAWHQVPDVDVNKPTIGSVWLQKYTGSVLKVNPDGSADYVYANGTPGPHVNDAAVATGNGNWVPLPDNHPLIEAMTSAGIMPGSAAPMTDDAALLAHGSWFPKLVQDLKLNDKISMPSFDVGGDEHLATIVKTDFDNGIINAEWTDEEGLKQANILDALGGNEEVMVLDQGDVEPAKTPNGFIPGIYHVVVPGQPHDSINGLPLQINPDGSGAWLYSQHPVGGMNTDNPLDPATISNLAGGSYVFDVDPADGTPNQPAPAPSPATEPATTEAAYPAAPPETVELAAILDYPPDYAWPIVPGAPPATAVAGGSKQIKGASLRAGDVISLNIAAAGQPLAVSVVKIKKEGAATKVWYQSAGGQTDWFILQGDETATAIARTPHPQITAQAKKAKQALENHTYLAETAAEVEPAAPKVDVPVGKYVNPIGTVMTVHPNGTATLDYPGTGSTSQLVSAEVVQSLWSTDGMDWVPKTVVTPTGAVLSQKGIDAAKPKSWNSTLLTAGATILLPKGGSMVITTKGYKPGVGYVIHGTPSKDAHPDYLTETDAELHVSGGTVMFVPKVVINKGGAYDFGWQPPTVPLIPDVPPVASVSAQAAGVLPPPPTLSTVGWKQVGTQAGSNLGGLFTTPTNWQYYVKKPKTELHVENEVLANRLYAAAGVKVPVVSFATLEPSVLGGGKGLASEVVPGKKNLAAKYSDPAYRAKLYDGFAVHAWLGNWDCVGTGKDNIIENDNGDPVMVDGGGSMLFRAMGTPKSGGEWGPKVTEDVTLRSGTAKDSTDVFGPMTDAQVKASIAKHLAPLLPAQIDALVKTTMTSDPTVAANLAATLKARRLDLLKRYGVVAPETVVPAHPVVDVPGGVLVPLSLGDGQVASEQVTIAGKDVWFHTTTVPATKIPVGAVLFLNDKPEAPWVVTKHALKDPNGKMGLWGKMNGTGPEQWLLQEVTSSQGERQVRCQTAPPAGWAPPPPPPPAVPGVKLVPRKNKAGGVSSTPSEKNAVAGLNSSLNRKVALKSAFARATPEMLAQLSAVGLGSASAFVDHFSQLSSNWDGSCASHINVLAMHHAVAMEFGLEDVAPWSNEIKNMTTKTQVQKYYAKWGKAYQAGARLIWMETQERLKAKGVDYLGVSRGFGFLAPDSSGAGQGSVSNFGGNVPAPPWAWTNGQHSDVTLRPLSSFSFSHAIGSTTLSAAVPRELIFSINATGFGTSGETEVIILGVKGLEWKLAGAKPPQSPSFTVASYAAKFPEWAPGSYQLKKGEAAMNVYPCIETEDYHKAFGPWPFVDEDGDDVDTYAEFCDLFPTVDPVELLDLPVGQTMPAKLRAELEEVRASDEYSPLQLVGEGDDMRYPPLDPSRIHDTTGQRVCPGCGDVVEFDPIDGWQRLDGSVGHDTGLDGVYGNTHSDVMEPPETKAAPDFSTGVMVCLRPVGKAAGALADAATDEAAADLHCTLAYLGKLTDLTDDQVARLRAAVAGFASVHAPIRGEVNGVARFADTGDGVPTVALVDSPALPAFRAELVEALEGLPVSTTHGFTAHITLGYDVDGEPAEDVNGTPLVFSAIHLVLGDDEESFDLAAPAETKAADLEALDDWVGLV